LLVVGISAIGRSNNLLLSGRQFVHQPPAIHLASIDPFWSRYKSFTLKLKKKVKMEKGILLRFSLFVMSHVIELAYK
jgi:hypothetical protein